MSGRARRPSALSPTHHSERSSLILRKRHASASGRPSLRLTPSSLALIARTRRIADATNMQHAIAAPRSIRRPNSNLGATDHGHPDDRRSIAIGPDARLLGAVAGIGAVRREAAKMQPKAAGTYAGV